MSELEEKELTQRIKAMSVEEQVIAIKYIHDEILLDELKDRIAQAKNVTYLVDEMLEGRR